MKDVSFFCLFDAFPTKKAVIDATPFFEVAKGLFVTWYNFGFPFPLFRSPCLSSVCSIFMLDFYCRCTSTGLFFVFFMALRWHLGYIYEKRQKKGNSKFQNSCVFKANKNEKW